MLFDNRIEVSRYYSVDKAINETEFPILIQILESVTIDPATVSLAKLVIDSQQESVKSLADLNGSNGGRFVGRELCNACSTNTDKLSIPHRISTGATINQISPGFAIKDTSTTPPTSTAKPSTAVPTHDRHDACEPNC